MGRKIKPCLSTGLMHEEGMYRPGCILCRRIKHRAARKKESYKIWEKQHIEKKKKTTAYKAWIEVRKALKKGILKRAKEFKCVDCGEPAFCYDHRDYLKPLEVQPVCRKCNWYRGKALNHFNI